MITTIHKQAQLFSFEHSETRNKKHKHLHTSLTRLNSVLLVCIIPFNAVYKVAKPKHIQKSNYQHILFFMKSLKSNSNK